MAFFILLAFIAVPIVEIAVIIEVGSYLGVWLTVLAILGTAVLGTALLRHQGMATLQKAQANLEAGVMPMAEVFDGLCLLLAGALLLTPGFVTDAVGFSLFLPPVRALLKRGLGNAFELKTMHAGGPDPFKPMNGDVIDGEFTDVTDEKPPKPLP